MKEYFLGIFRSDRREIPSFNGIRTIGFLMLVYAHMFRSVEALIPDINPYLRNFLNNGSVCLDMFFPLSGFLIASPLFAELESRGTVNWKLFYTKRFLRIFPPYYAFLLLQYFVFIPALVKNASPEMLPRIEALKGAIWFDVFYLTDYFRGTILHGWSLSVEEQFYILFPAFLLLIFRYIPRRFRLGSLILVALLPLVYRAIFMYAVVLKAPLAERGGFYDEYFYYPFHGHIDSVLYGIILAYIFNFRKQWVARVLHAGRWAHYAHAGFWVALITLSFLVDEFAVGTHQIIRFPTFSLIWVGIMVFSMRKGDLIGRFLSFRLFSPFAKLSYCAYIIHIVAMAPISRKLLLADQKVEQHEFFLYAIPVALVVFSFAYIYYLLTERPFAVIKDRLIARYRLKTTSEVFSEQMQKVG